MASNATLPSLTQEQTLKCIQDTLILAALDLGSTIGVAFIGVAISSMAYGVTCCQTFYYYRSNRGRADPWYYKTLVAVLLILDSLHQALIIHSLYYYLVENYGNSITLTMNVWSLSAEIIVNAAIAFIVETFLVYRVFRLSRNLWVTGFCGLFTIAHLVMNLIFPIRALFYPELAVALVKLKATGSSGLVVAVVADVSISAAMAFYLNRSRTGFRRSDDMITKIMALTITTGSLTTVFVIGDLIAYLAAPQALYVLFFNFMLGKLYINALLTSLNTRDLVRGTMASEHSTTSKGINSIPLSGFSRDAHIRTHPHPVNVMVEQAIEVDKEMSKPYNPTTSFDSKPPAF